jgi:hypothetical protein
MSFIESVAQKTETYPVYAQWVVLMMMRCPK